MAPSPKRKKIPGLPSRAALLAWIKDNPDKTDKRSVARAFNLKGQQKIDLKAMLKDLAADGVLEKKGKRFAKPGTLPTVTVLDILTRDRDGGLLAKPVDWDEATGGKAPTVAIVQDRNAKGPTAGIGDRVLARIRNESGSYRAKVMKILDKDRGTVLGVYRANKKPEDGMAGRIEPVERKQDELMVLENAVGDAQDGDLVEVTIAKSGRYGLKRAKIERVIGDYRSEKAVSLIALHQHKIPIDFPDAVMKEAEKAGPADMKKREDWRELPLITIDPADAKDHDDAIYAAPDDNENNKGGFVVTVAIADVSWYVRPGSQMDQEAQKRGNSVYFPDRVVPMLPERISNELCSLKEDVDRPALAVRMIFDADGHKRSHTFHRIMMRSHARLAYTEAQDAIDGRDAPRAQPWLENVLKPLWQAYFALRKGRNDRGPLELDMPERKILLDENGNVDRVIVPPRLDAHKLVEEFMIQANVAAAETLERKKQPLIYRTHDAPSMAKLESLREFLRSLAIPLARAGQLRPTHFNDILRQVEETEHKELVNQVVLRSQSQAAYTQGNIGHFGLNLAKYAHFTSPIRRYADLIVHRALVGALGLGDGAITPEEEARLDVIAEEISLTERRAMLAERQTVDRLISAHLADKIGAEFDGRINGVTRAGLFVTLTETGADGFIPISKLGDDYYIYNETTHAVQGEHSGTLFQMGDEVRVKLIEATPLAGALLFQMISEGREGDALPRTKRSRPGSPSGKPKRPPKRAGGGNKFGQKRSSRGR
ncbi:ribonuclease R [Pseudahrensia aquimaris]|uniref:Ribonuclease R n=1 Tax=Pseudahrensia aquimaris TaxID=744461 RepID=A0ABW3FHT0_9HYPH